MLTFLYFEGITCNFHPIYKFISPELTYQDDNGGGHYTGISYNEGEEEKEVKRQGQGSWADSGMIFCYLFPTDENL